MTQSSLQVRTVDPRGSDMWEIQSFAYPDDDTAAFCESRAMNIRRLISKTVRTVAEIGRLLEEVRNALPHGLWGSWLDHHFGWSEETARRYRHLARAVDDNPRILDFPSIELAILFPSLPQRTQQAILEAGAVRLKDAQTIIARHKAEDWRQEVDRLIRRDPGRAQYEIELAMDEADLREEAKAAMREHASLLAEHAGRPAAELMAAAGLSLEERLPTPAQGRITAKLYEENSERRLVLWAANKPHTIAVFPQVEHPVAMAQQAAIILRAVGHTRARTYDDDVAASKGGRP